MSKFVKRFLMLFLLVISFFSTSVFAKEVDIKVDEAKVVSKSSTAEVETPAIDGNNVNTSATFNEQDDFVTYEITIKNNDDDSWKIDSVEDNYTKDNLKIDYEYDKDLIEKGKTSKVKVTITYKKKLVNTESINIDDLKISLNLINESGDTTTIGINNPNTRDGILKYLVLLIVAVTGLIFIKNKKRYKRLKVGKLLVIIAIVMSPFIIFAEEKYQININIKSFTLKSEYLDYEISFDTDGAGNVDTRTVTYGQPIGELPNVSKDGYTFNGWKDQDGNVVTENTIVKGKLDLEAEFTVKEYNIAYNLDNGTVTPSSANPTKYTVEDEFELVNPTRKGYTFAGWTEGESENLYTRVTISHETGTKAYTAHWSKNENTKYYVNHKYPNLDGTYETVREELKGPTDTEVTAPFKPKTGFDNPTTSQNLTISADEDSEVTYTYTRHEYNLTLNDDIETTFTNSTYPYETEITLTAKDKENFEFTGWSNGETTKTITFNITEDTNVYPEYVSTLITVTFNPNGGTVDETTRSVNKETAIGELPTPTAPTGKSFSNWYTGLTDGTVVTSSYTPNSNITIYARYYKDVTGATVSPSSISLIKGNEETLIVSNVEEEYTFSSNDESIATVDQTGKVTGTGVGTTTITITGSTSGKTKTIEVTVEASTYTVTLNAQDGTLTQTSITQEIGTPIGELPIPTPPENYEFDAWYTGISDGIEVTSSYMPNSNVTIYARYTENVCKTFSTDSWSTIENNIKNIPDYYAVGCEKEVELDMDDDNTPESYTVRLANTSTPEECSVDGYSQTACGIVIEFIDFVTLKRMNPTDTNAGGWKETEMVTYLNNDFYNKLPNDIKSLIIPTYPIVSSSGKTGVSADITATDTDKNKIYLLSSREIGVERDWDNKNDVTTDTRTLDYYDLNNNNESRIKYNLDGLSKYWWTRSASNTTNSSFISVITTGNPTVNPATDTTKGIAPAFRIGTTPKNTVTFDTDGGSDVSSQTVIYGKKVTKPKNNPTKDGFVFAGWYTSDSYETEFDFSKPITKATTIYAKFDKLKTCAENENITKLSKNTCSANENITVDAGIVCKRAINLHQEECTPTNSSYCIGSGYSQGDNITYGSCGTSGTLTSGDAFTCDVNGDGDFDELTERFYYTSDYYNTKTKSYDDTTAVLIFYNNVVGGVSCNKNTYAYDSSNENWHGPSTAVNQLPTTSKWSNVSLKNTTRQILTDSGTTSTNGGALPKFDYSGYAARLITIAEIKNACGDGTLTDKYYLDSCNYVLENTKYAKTSIGTFGSWLESPNSASVKSSWVIHSENHNLNRNIDSYNKGGYGVRPVIDVPKTKISY